MSQSVNEKIRRRREHMAAHALDSSRLEGGRPSEKLQADLKRYARGEVTIAELEAEVLSPYAGR